MSIHLPEDTNNYFELYFNYVSSAKECPIIYHRWAALSTLSALIGPKLFFQHGHFKILPNLYIMLIGNPGARKSTSIKLAKTVLEKAGYENFAANKTTKEKFLLDLNDRHEITDDSNLDNILDRSLFSDLRDHDATTDVFIAADEFNNFIGINNISFISLLGELWDHTGVYKDRLKNSKSIEIPNPVINILGGNTHQGFTLCFPPETLGQGFMSRLILVHGSSTGIKIPFPEKPCPEAEQQLVNYLLQVQNLQGQVELTKEARELLEDIYINTSPLSDSRFESYSTRRFTQLIKLIILCAASRLDLEVTTKDVLLANTILTNTEVGMPRALGEFGRAKNSSAVHKVIEALENAVDIMTLQDIWKVVINELEHPEQLVAIIQSLKMADKIMEIPSKHGYIIKKRRLSIANVEHTVDFSLLYPGEYT